MERSLRSARAVPMRQGYAIAFSEAEAHALRLNAHHDDELARTQKALDKERMMFLNAAQRETELLQEDTRTSSPALPQIHLSLSDPPIPGILRSSGSTSPVPSCSLSVSNETQQDETSTFRLLPNNLRLMGFLTRSLPTFQSLSAAGSLNDGLLSSQKKTEPARYHSASNGVDLPPLLRTPGNISRSSSAANSNYSRHNGVPSYASPATSRRKPRKAAPPSTLSMNSSYTLGPARLPSLINDTDAERSASREEGQRHNRTGTRGSVHSGMRTSDGYSSASSPGIHQLRIVSVVGPAKSDDQAAADWASSDSSDDDSAPVQQPVELNPFRVRKDWTASSDLVREPITMEEARQSTYVRLPPKLNNMDVHEQYADQDAAKAVFA